jgi:hypothetical protein
MPAIAATLPVSVSVVPTVGNRCRVVIAYVAM